MSTGDQNSQSKKNRVSHIENKKAESKQVIALTPDRPSLFVDSHMHIQSGNCSTLIFLQSQLKGTPVSRGFLDTLAPVAGIFGNKSVTGEFEGGMSKSEASKLASQDTYKIGMELKKQLSEVSSYFRGKDPYRKSSQIFPLGIIMPMDMEYAHLAGYYGIKIYNPIYASDAEMKKANSEKYDEENPVEPAGYWYPNWQLGKEGPPNIQRTDNYHEEGETKAQYKDLSRARSREGIQGFYYDSKGVKTSKYVYCRMDDTSDSETKRYETWKKQLRNTQKALLEGNLELLSMFHFDPRRWQAGTNAAFQAVGPNGIFLGFKMYTAQGFRPLDTRLPILNSFYQTCQELQIPIMNHCNSEGASTYDREFYFYHMHPMDTFSDRQEKVEFSVRRSAKEWIEIPYKHKGTFADSYMAKGYSKNELLDIIAGKKQVEEWMLKAIYDYYEKPPKDGNDTVGSQTRTLYFKERFISPSAWKIVLEKFPELRLCLAHFGGGNGDYEKGWGKEIAEMMKKDEKGQPIFPNLYADISFSFGIDGFPAHFKQLLHDNPHIKERILFGSDWFMTLLSQGKNVLVYCKQAKDFLDGIDKKLWLKFTEENPARFYQLKTEVGRIARI